VTTAEYDNGWPTVQKDGKAVDDDSALDGADAVVVICDGGNHNPLLLGDRLDAIGRLMKKGVGLALIHWADEATKEKGENEFLDWVGGAAELNMTVNSHWLAEFKTLPVHPVTRGVKPFSTVDEWSFPMRFRSDMHGITPLLVAVPPVSTMKRPDGPRSGNPEVRAAVTRGDPQTVAWVVDRADGGRGFAISGGHFHAGYKHDDERKLVLNAIVWVAHGEVPENGVPSTVTDEQLKANLDAVAAKHPSK